MYMYYAEPIGVTPAHGEFFMFIRNFPRDEYNTAWLKVGKSVIMRRRIRHRRAKKAAEERQKDRHNLVPHRRGRQEKK